MNVPVATSNDRVNPLETNQRVERNQNPRGKDISRLMARTGITCGTTNPNKLPPQTASTTKLLSAPTRSILATLSLPSYKTLVVVTNEKKKTLAGIPARCASVDDYFPVVVHRMIHDAEKQNASDIMSWEVGGESFRVNELHPNLPKFIERYFRHSKYTSFQRQLNTYGWSKMKFGPHAGMFYQQGFHKDATIEEIIKIRRGGTKPEEDEPPATRSRENDNKGHLVQCTALQAAAQTSPAAGNDHTISLTTTIPLKKRKVQPSRGASKYEAMKRKRLERRLREPSVGGRQIVSAPKALLRCEQKIIPPSNAESHRSELPALGLLPATEWNVVHERGSRLRTLASELGHRASRVSPACSLNKQSSDGSHLSCQRLFSPLLPSQSQQARKKKSHHGNFTVSYQLGSPTCLGLPLQDIQTLWAPHTPQMDQKTVHPISESSMVDTPFLTNPSNLNASLDQVVDIKPQVRGTML